MSSKDIVGWVEKGWLNYCNDCERNKEPISLYFVKSSDISRNPMIRYKSNQFTELHKCNEIRPIYIKQIQEVVKQKYLKEGSKVKMKTSGIEAVVHRIFASGSVTLKVAGQAGVLRVRKNELELI